MSYVIISLIEVMISVGIWVGIIWSVLSLFDRNDDQYLSALDSEKRKVMTKKSLLIYKPYTQNFGVDYALSKQDQENGF